MTHYRSIKTLLKSAALGIATVASIACSPVKTLNALVPNASFSLHADIAYGDLLRQKLDIYVPKNASQNTPVVIFYYGGSWDSGNKVDYKFVAEAFASNGYIAVVPDYRVYPDVLFPAFMADAASAAKWVKNNIPKYQGNANQVFLAGHSAGAHLAVMLAVNPQYLAVEGLSQNDFAGVIGLAGPYDFLPLKSERLKTIFGPEEVRWQSQPIAFVNGKNPPMLLLVGLKDSTVWPHNTYNLAEKIKAKGGKVQVAEFANYGHIDMAAKLAKPLRGDRELLNSILAFMQQQTQLMASKL
jgi:acetyl esterase/lipase